MLACAGEQAEVVLLLRRAAAGGHVWRRSIERCPPHSPVRLLFNGGPLLLDLVALEREGSAIGRDRRPRPDACVSRHPRTGSHSRSLVAWFMRLVNVPAVRRGSCSNQRQPCKSRAGDGGRLFKKSFAKTAWHPRASGARPVGRRDSVYRAALRLRHAHGARLPVGFSGRRLAISPSIFGRPGSLRRPRSPCLRAACPSRPDDWIWPLSANVLLCLAIAFVHGVAASYFYYYLVR